MEPQEEACKSAIIAIFKKLSKFDTQIAFIIGAKQEVHMRWGSTRTHGQRQLRHYGYHFVAKLEVLLTYQDFRELCTNYVIMQQIAKNATAAATKQDHVAWSTSEATRPSGAILSVHNG